MRPHSTLSAACLAVSTLFLLPETGAAAKLCYQIPDAAYPPFLIVAVNKDTDHSVLEHNKAVRSGKLRVSAEPSADALFVRRPLVAGDCLLIDPREKVGLLVSHRGKGLEPPGAFKKFSRGFKKFFGRSTEFEKTALYPAVGIAHVTGERFYGWLDGSRLEELFPTPSVPELGEADLLRHSADATDLTLIYVLCEKSRKRLCTLKIRHLGEWLEDPETGRPFTMKVLARSRRETGGDAKQSYRIHPGGDTPQGIYLLWASMYSAKKIFGKEPRIDLDAQKQPMNAEGNTKYAAALRRIVPEEHWNDYWLNEWPLAFNLGRVLMRIHGNSIDPETPSTFKPEDSDILYRPTSGCINTGHRQRTFLDVMVSLGVFEEDKVQIPADKKHFWERAPSLGKVFLIVKDID